MTAEKQFLFTGNGPCMNRGCEALLIGTMEILRQTFGECTFINSFYLRADSAEEEREDTEQCTFPGLVQRPDFRRPCKKFSPYWFSRQIKKTFGGLKYGYDFSFDKYMKKTSAMLSLGGDNFTLDYGPPHYHISVGKYCKDKGVPLVIWGASIGPFSADKEYEKAITPFFRQVDLITVRETSSQKYLSELGIADNVKLVADPAFAMTPQKCVISDVIAKALNDGAIGINLSPLVGKFRNNDNDWFTDALQAVKDAASLGMSVILIPHVMTNGSNDYLFLKKIKDNCNCSNVFLLEPLRAAEVKWIISQLKAFAGARTHSTIAALSTCVPTLSIGYSTKAQGLNNDIFGTTQWLLPIQEFSPSSFVSHLSELINNAENCKQHLEIKMPEYKAQAMLGGKYLSELL